MKNFTDQMSQELRNLYVNGKVKSKSHVVLNINLEKVKLKIYVITITNLVFSGGITAEESEGLKGSPFTFGT